MRTLITAVACLAATALPAQQSVSVPPPRTTVTVVVRKDSLAVGDTIRDVTGAYLLRVQSVPAPPVVVVPPPIVTQPPPTTQPPTGAVVAIDFSKYSTTQLRDGSWWKATGKGDMGGISHPELISFDSSEQALRYDWPSRTGTTCTSEYTVHENPRLNPLSATLPAGARDLWVEFVSKESQSFSHGNPGCVRSYKFFLLQFEAGGSTKGRAGLYLGDGTPASTTSTTAFMDLSDFNGAYQYTRPNIAIGGDAGWGGVYHRWTMEVRGLGTASATFSVYLDGVKLYTLTDPKGFLNGANLQAGYVLYLEMGANMNNGPDRAQSRWFKELRVYTTKPSTIP